MINFTLPKDIQEKLNILKKQTETSKINTIERNILREKIKNSIFKKIEDFQIPIEKKLDIVMGNPGSGKNSAISEPLLETKNSFILDNDDVKKLLPEFDGGLGAFLVHEESSKIVDDLYHDLIQEGYNLIYPTVGKTYESLKRKIEYAKNNGYEVNLHYCDLSIDKTAERIIKRFEHTGRYVSLDYLYNSVKDNPLKNYELAKKERLCDNYLKYDNDVPLGHKAILLEKLDYNLNDKLNFKNSVKNKLEIKESKPSFSLKNLNKKAQEKTKENIPMNKNLQNKSNKI